MKRVAPILVAGLALFALKPTAAGGAEETNTNRLIHEKSRHGGLLDEIPSNGIASSFSTLATARVC